MTNLQLENKIIELEKQLKCKVQRYATLEDFPVVGSACPLYLDLETSTLYYWDGNSYEAIGGGGGGTGDNLGNHLATQNLDMDGNNITNVPHIFGQSEFSNLSMPSDSSNNFNLSQVDGNSISMSSDTTESFIRIYGPRPILTDNDVLRKDEIFDSSNKLYLANIPDAILGQLVYGGTANTTTAVATLTTNAQTKLGTGLSTITLTNDVTAITGYPDNEGIYYIVTTGGTFASVSFSVGDWLVSTGSGWEKVDNTDAITTVNGQTGIVTLNTSNISENTNLYFTEARVRATPLTGLSLASSADITAADTVLSGFGKLQAQIDALPSGSFWNTAGNTSIAGLTLGSTDNTALTITAGTAAININNSSTGTINMGSGANAQAINIGAGAAVKTIVIGTTTAGTTTQVLAGSGTGLTIGSSTGDVSINAVNPNTGNVNIKSSTAGTVNICSGTSVNTVNINSGAAAKTTNLGSTNTTSTTTINSGSGAINLNINNNQPTNINTGTSTGTVTIGGSQAQTVNINATGVSKATTLGSTGTNSTTTINAGTGGIGFGGIQTVTGATSAIANAAAVTAGVAVGKVYRWDDGDTYIMCLRK